jgi:DNA-binding NtrC family response regulator
MTFVPKCEVVISGNPSIKECVDAHFEGLLWAFTLSGMSYTEFERVIQKRLIEHALAKNNYIRGRAAEQLLIRRDVINHRIKKLGIAMPPKAAPKRRRRG